jgi:hypothetical protein
MQPAMALVSAGCAGFGGHGTVAGLRMSSESGPVGLGSQLSLAVLDEEAHLMVVHRPLLHRRGEFVLGAAWV